MLSPLPPWGGGQQSPGTARQRNFTSQVGGLLPKQIDSIVRRGWAGPAWEGDNGVAVGGRPNMAMSAAAALESEELSALGLIPVQGL